MAKPKSPTRTLNLVDKPLRDVLFQMCDDRFISGTITRTGDRRFTARITLQKKTKT